MRTIKRSTDIHEIESIKNKRFYVDELPEKWKNTPLGINTDTSKEYSINGTEFFGGHSTFGNNPNVVGVSECKQDEIPEIGTYNNTYPIAIENVRQGLRTIKVGGVSVSEHFMGFMNAMNLRVNASLMEPSFPSTPEGTKMYMNGLYNENKTDKYMTETEYDNKTSPPKVPILKEIGDMPYMTVKQPTIIYFKNKGYTILEPDNGEKKLSIDQQISFRNVLGTQRIKEEITPEFFNFFSKARAGGFGVMTKGYKMLKSMGIKRVPFTSISDDNFLHVDTWEYLNENSEFSYKGKNFEFILHELIDKLGALEFLRYEGINKGKFVGTMTNFYAGHIEDMEVVTAMIRGDIQTVMV